jgi:hypothetical protein
MDCGRAVLMTLLECITQASGKGFKVSHSEGEGFYITTPKAPYRPSQELGPYQTERTAWVDAALLCRQ